MFFPGTQEDSYVIKIKQTCLPIETGEDSVHETRKGSRGIAEAERYLIKLIHLAATGPKLCFQPVPFADKHLPVPTVEIKSREPTGAMEGFE